MILKNYFKYKTMNFVTLAIFLIIWYLISYLIIFVPGNFLKLIAFITALSLILILFVSFINKFGFILMFYVFMSLIGIKIPGLEVFKYDILIAIVVGIIFETLFLLFYLLLKNQTQSRILSISLSNSSIIIFLGLFISYGFLINNLNNLINLFFILFLINLVGSILGLLLWHHIRSFKIMLKLEYKNL